MERYERFLDMLLAALTVALFCTNVFVVVYVSMAIEYGLLAALGLVVSGAFVGAIVAYFAGLRRGVPQSD